MTAHNAFARDLTEVINRHSVENVSNTPDIVLGEFLVECLDAFDAAVNARTALAARPDEREFAWHELRLFTGPALLDEGDVNQHELTHPDQCRTLPPGAACWAEHQPFRWWWPTAHGTYRIRPEDVLTGGSEDGPDWNVTLRVQVRNEAGEWVEYDGDTAGPDPVDDRPAIVARLKAAAAEKSAQDERDGDVRAERDMCTCGESKTVCELRTELDQLRAQLKIERNGVEADPDCEELVEIFADFIGQWDRSHEVITVGLPDHLPQLRIPHLRRAVVALQRLGRERDAALEARDAKAGG